MQITECVMLASKAQISENSPRERRHRRSKQGRRRTEKTQQTSIRPRSVGSLRRGAPLIEPEEITESIVNKVPTISSRIAERFVIADAEDQRFRTANDAPETNRRVRHV
jgi:hypothetical protein